MTIIITEISTLGLVMLIIMEDIELSSTSNL